VGLLEAAGTLPGRAGERALLVAEQLGLQEVLRDRGAVHLDERVGLAVRELVDDPGDEGLARAGLAQEEHRGLGRRDLADLALDLLHGLALAHDGRAAALAGDLVAQGDVLAHQGLLAGPDLLVEAQELADERGHHGEEVQVLVVGHVVPEQPVHVEHADGPAVEHDRHAHEGDPALFQLAGAGAVQEQGLLADVRHHVGLGGLEDEPGDALAQVVDPAGPLLGREAVGGADDQASGLGVHQGHGGPLHAQGLGEDPQDLGEGFLQFQGLVDPLADGREDLELEAAQGRGHGAGVARAMPKATVPSGSGFVFVTALKSLTISRRDAAHPRTRFWELIDFFVLFRAK